MTLTNEQKKAYLADSGHCPFCKSNKIEADEMDWGNNQCWQNVECLH